MTLLIHAAAAWFMAGVIWIMQFVHYPSLDQAAPAVFERNARLTAFVIVPVMLAEMATALMISNSFLAQIGVVLLAVAWCSTLLVQYPLHRRLSRRFAPDDYARLLRTNWIRVAAWSARGVIALMLLRRAS